MASLLIVTGPAGAGKSTVAKVLARGHPSSVLVEGDRFFDFLAEGAIEPWLPSAERQNLIVADSAARATGSFANSYDTIYDGVVRPSFLPVFAAATGVAVLDYVILLPPLEVCLARVAERAGHQFADEPATREMHHEFSMATIDPRHVFRTGTSGVDELAAAIRRAQTIGDLRRVVRS